MSDLDVADFGIVEVSRSEFPAEIGQRLASTLDRSGLLVEAGQSVPLLWHWVFFTPTSLTRDLGPDGHARLPPDGPTRGFPRRMFAGGSIQQVGPLVFGSPAERHASLTGYERKEGRSGPLVLLHVHYDLYQAGGLAVTEEQSLVYLPPTSRGVRLPPDDHQGLSVPPGGWVEEVEIGSALLFRYSAVTFNAHRIHYDGEYARAAEGYPELVVQGPLVATLLADSALENVGELDSFSFRATAPLFKGSPLQIVGELHGSRVELRAVRSDDVVAMHGTGQLTAP